MGSCLKRERILYKPLKERFLEESMDINEGRIWSRTDNYEIYTLFKEPTVIVSIKSSRIRSLGHLMKYLKYSYLEDRRSRKPGLIKIEITGCRDG